jgi:hypothetical protein
MIYLKEVYKQITLLSARVSIQTNIFTVCPRAILKGNQPFVSMQAWACNIKNLFNTFNVSRVVNPFTPL